MGCPAASVAIHFATEGRVPKKQNRCMSFFLISLHISGKEKDVPLVEFVYLVFTRMPGERYRRRLMFVVFV